MIQVMAFYLNQYWLIILPECQSIPDPEMIPLRTNPCLSISAQQAPLSSPSRMPGYKPLDRGQTRRTVAEK